MCFWRAKLLVSAFFHRPFLSFTLGGKGFDEAAENRNYLSGRMGEEVNELIRVLQLTTYDEDEWNSDNVTVMKKAVNAIESDMQNAHDWIKVSARPRGRNDSITMVLELTTKKTLVRSS